MKENALNAIVIIAAHKKSPLPTDPLYMPVQVGAESKESIGYTRDDTGDNISAKNPRYSELTGLYWMWKNIRADYRRFFTLNRRRKKHEISDALSSAQLSKLIPQYKVIVPRKTRYYIETLYSHYSHTFFEEHLVITRDIIQQRCPEYTDAFDRTLKQTCGFMYNMMIMQNSLLSDYCAWLFDILFELEDQVDTRGMSEFHQRFCGRISERLFNVWLNHQIECGNLRRDDIVEIPYMYLGEVNWSQKIMSFLMAKVFHRKYEKSF